MSCILKSCEKKKKSDISRLKSKSWTLVLMGQQRVTRMIFPYGRTNYSWMLGIASF